MNKLEFKISDNSSLLVKTSANEFNIGTYSSKVDLIIENNENELKIGEYYTLFEVLNEIKNAIEEIGSNNRNLDFINFELIKELNKTNYELHLTEDMNYLDRSNELLKYILFDGNYFVGLYNIGENIFLEIGPKYDDFDDMKNLKENFNNWLSSITIVTYNLSKETIETWLLKLIEIKNTGTFG